MKKLFLAFTICIVTSFVANAQTPPLNQQQTLDYITKLWKANLDNAESSITSVTMDGKIFVVKFKIGESFVNTYRTDLTIINASLLKITNSEYSGKTYYKIVYEFAGANTKDIIFSVLVESDVNRLKKALAHLIELVKAEKSTDPFDN